MHQPVLAKEVVELVQVRAGGRYVDGTLGAGGHTIEILKRVGPAGVVMGVDRDADAIDRVKERLAADPLTACATASGRCVLVHANYAQMADVARRYGIEEADGVVLDLGVSSEQLDTPDRGFSFLHDGPLDMRMNRTEGLTAEDLVNGMDEDALNELIQELGEDRMARRIARAIIRARSRVRIATTRQLAEIVETAVGGRKGRLHPATRTFQALRIRVNDELDSLAQGLRQGLGLLAPGGRMAVISFHSLEDRMVKNTFRRHVGRWEALQAGGRRWDGDLPAVRPVTGKPVQALSDEVDRNPRARSAKLRVVERLCDTQQIQPGERGWDLLKGAPHGAAE